jgi:hypothetical protein
MNILVYFLIKALMENGAYEKVKKKSKKKQKS